MNDGSSLPSDKANRIAEAIESLERNVTALRQKQSISRSAYTGVGNQDLRDSVERKFEKLAEAILDIADQVLKHECGASPNGRNEKIRALHRENVLDAQLTQDVLDAVGFKEVLSHTYGPIINDDIVYDALQNSLQQYVDFAEAIDEYLRK
jgi:uncharacterized protein YutE (UPF0331/DUF86 family)